jgi:hypothetical protein
LVNGGWMLSWRVDDSVWEDQKWQVLEMQACLEHQLKDWIYLEMRVIGWVFPQWMVMVDNEVEP